MNNYTFKNHFVKKFFSYISVNMVDAAGVEPACCII